LATLSNYPNISQLSAKVNGPWDCVPTSIIDGLEYLTGKHYDIDALVQAAYGPGHTGGTAAAAYVAFCASVGVHLYPIDGPPQTLVADLHTLIQESKPCLLTEPDVYAPLHPDWSHVLSVYSEAPGTLTARDPYSTRDVTHSDSQWAQLLEFREIWVLEGEIMPLDIAMPAVAALFMELDATHWKSKASGCVLQDGLLADYKKNGLVSLDYLGDVIQNEVYLPELGPGKVMQRYKRGVRLWDNGAVSSLDLDAGPGQDPLVDKLKAMIAAMQSGSSAPQLTAAAIQAGTVLANATGHKFL
jgi:hypothetical protein